MKNKPKTYKAWAFFYKDRLEQVECRAEPIWLDLVKEDNGFTYQPCTITIGRKR